MPLVLISSTTSLVIVLKATKEDFVKSILMTVLESTAIMEIVLILLPIICVFVIWATQEGFVRQWLMTVLKLRA
jgi:hypothetical protein